MFFYSSATLLFSFANRCAVGKSEGSYAAQISLFNRRLGKTTPYGL
jgi:hypothetical protein